MVKKWHSFSVLRCSRFLSLFLAFLILFISVSEVNAESLNQHYIGYYDLNYGSKSQNYLSVGSGNTTLPSTVWTVEGDSTIFSELYLDSGGVDINGYLEESGNSIELCVDYFLGAEQKFFTPSNEYYAYNIILKPTNVSGLTLKNVKWLRPVVGNYSDIFTADAQIGRAIHSGSLTTNDWSSFYLVTNYSTQAIYIGLLAKFICTDNSVVSGLGSWSFSNLSFSYEVYGYTKEEFDASIEAEAKKQTELQQDMLEQDKAQTEELKEQTETQKGMLSSIKDFFGSFFQNLIDSVIGLFVPSKEELGDIFQRFDEFFSDKFGFLYFPIDVLTDFVSMVTSGSSAPEITFPSFSIMGYKVWDEYVVSFNTMPSIVTKVFRYVKMGTSVLISFWFISYLDKKFNLLTRG